MTSTCYAPAPLAPTAPASRSACPAGHCPQSRAGARTRPAPGQLAIGSRLSQQPDPDHVKASETSLGQPCSMGGDGFEQGSNAEKVDEYLGEWCAGKLALNEEPMDGCVGKSHQTRRSADDQISDINAVGKHCVEQCEAVGVSAEHISGTDVAASEKGSNDYRRRQHLMIGCRKFSKDPEKGIEYLMQHQLVGITAVEVAAFLFKGLALDKRAIGKYILRPHYFNQMVLKAFVSLHPLSNLPLLQALRHFLFSFHLMGEGADVTRVIECFAQRFYELNPAMFRAAETCVTLSLAIMMLNTSLHNRNVKTKLSERQFVDTVHDIDDSLPLKMLVNIYGSIKSQQIEASREIVDDATYAFSQPEHDGWLWKQGGRFKSWQRRWFFLKDNCLFYFEDQTRRKLRGVVPLENLELRVIPDARSRWCFELFASGSQLVKASKVGRSGAMVAGRHMVYRMVADCSHEMDAWLKAIRRSIVLHPLRSTVEDFPNLIQVETKAYNGRRRPSTGTAGRRMCRSEASV